MMRSIRRASFERLSKLPVFLLVALLICVVNVRGNAAAAAAPSTSNFGRYAPPTTSVRQQLPMPATEAECCDAGRLLYTSGGDSCNAPASAVGGGFIAEHRDASSSPSKLSPSSSVAATAAAAAAWTSESDGQPSSCDIVRTVCCLAERRQRLCRLGVDRVLSDGRDAAGDTPSAENSDEEDDEAGMSTDSCCGGAWTNNSDARECCECCRLGRIFVQSQTNGVRHHQQQRRRRLSCDPPPYYADQCRLTFIECCTTQLLAPVESWNHRRELRLQRQQRHQTTSTVTTTTVYTTTTTPTPPPPIVAMTSSAPPVHTTTTNGRTVIVQSRDLRNSRDYCPPEVLNVTCPPDSVIFMSSARYGRMSRHSKCLASTKQVGCHADVLPQLDRRCSGRRLCSIAVAELGKFTNPCRKDLPSYLEAGFVCQKVQSWPTSSSCRSHRNRRSDDYEDGGDVRGTQAYSSTSSTASQSSSGYLANVVTEEDGFGSTLCPWIVSASLGQQMRITLFDFGLSGTRGEPIDTDDGGVCREYAKVTETGTSPSSASNSSEFTICGGRSRQKSVFASSSNRLEIVIENPKLDNETVYFLLMFEVVGCADPPVPNGTTVHRLGDRAEVKCGATSETWVIVCKRTQWYGIIGNCIAAATVVEVDDVTTDGDNTTSSAVSAVIDAASGCHRCSERGLACRTTSNGSVRCVSGPRPTTTRPRSRGPTSTVPPSTRPPAAKDRSRPWTPASRRPTSAGHRNSPTTSAPPRIRSSTAATISSNRSSNASADSAIENRMNTISLRPRTSLTDVSSPPTTTTTVTAPTSKIPPTSAAWTTTKMYQHYSTSTRIKPKPGRSKLRVTSQPSPRERNESRQPARCASGLSYNRTSMQCQDIDECLVADRCSSESNMTCRNTIGSFTCVCNLGFRFNPRSRTCEDADECSLLYRQSNSSSNLLPSPLCGDREQCVNTVGSFVCRPTADCVGGFSVNPVTLRCDDVDECRSGIRGLCRSGTVCVNTPGSYRCVNESSVGCTGVNGTSGSCQHHRHPEQQSSSSLPLTPIREVCSRGMRFESSSGKCVDIDECKESSPCGPTQRCWNTVSSYVCHNSISCGPGYQLNAFGTRCDDIDECSLDLHNCTSSLMKCVNRPGTFVCKCPDGFQLDHSTMTCEDVDECSRHDGHVCAMNARCENTRGSFNCVCRHGYRLDAESKTCIDVDECQLRSSTCQQICRNTYGSFHCVCNDGYQLNLDGRTCSDVDECSVWGAEKASQLCLGLCHNVQGSYLCTCPAGYQMSSDGRTCEDVDECTDEEHESYNGVPVDCSGPDDVCVNTRGGYLCQSVVCPTGFIKAPRAAAGRLVTGRDSSGGTLKSARGRSTTIVDSGFSFTRVTDNRRDAKRAQTTANKARELASAHGTSTSSSTTSSTSNPRNNLRSVIAKPLPFFWNDDSGVVCLKAECRHNDVTCLMNLTRSVQWQHVSLPTIPQVDQPLTIMHLQSVAAIVPRKPDGTTRSGATNEAAQTTSFVIVGGNDLGLFDVIAAAPNEEEETTSDAAKADGDHRPGTANTGSIRLLRPLHGPAEHVLTLKMDVRGAQNVVISRNVAHVTIHVSRYRF